MGVFIQFCLSGRSMNRPHYSTSSTARMTLVMRETLNNPEWARFPRPGERVMGFGRSTLYQLASEGSIRTVALKRPGAVHGMRFVYLPSLAALLENAESNRRPLVSVKNAYVSLLKKKRIRERRVSVSFGTGSQGATFQIVGGSGSWISAELSISSSSVSC